MLTAARPEPLSSGAARSPCRPMRVRRCLSWAKGKNKKEKGKEGCDNNFCGEQPDTNGAISPASCEAACRGRAPVAVVYSYTMGAATSDAAPGDLLARRQRGRAQRLGRCTLPEAGRHRVSRDGSATSHGRVATAQGTYITWARAQSPPWSGQGRRRPKEWFLQGTSTGRGDGARERPGRWDRPSTPE